MKQRVQSLRRRPGRPMEFDREQVLHQAMLLFWRQGYETTSVAELLSHMKITAPSLYAAFGDKEGLFLAAVERYTCAGPVTALGLIKNAATARDAARTLLLASATAFTGRHTPPGCLLASAATTGSTGAANVQKALAKIRLTIEANLRNKAKADLAAGRLPPGTDVEALASLTVAVIQGMSTLARDGAGRSKLLSLVEAAMHSWPV